MRVCALYYLPKKGELAKKVSNKVYRSAAKARKQRAILNGFGPEVGIHIAEETFNFPDELPFGKSLWKAYRDGISR